MNIRITRVLMIILSLASCGDGNPPETLRPSRPVPPAEAVDGVEYGIGFPPIASPRHRALTREVLEEVGIDRIRITEDWCWRQKQRTGSYQWRAADKRYGFIKSSGIRPLVTLAARGPDWAVADPAQEYHLFTDLEAWDAFCQAFFRRYHDTLAVAQFGNEWISHGWFPGTAEQFVTIHDVFSRAVRAEAPDVKIALGGFTYASLLVLAVIQGDLDSYTDYHGKTVNLAALEQQYGEAKQREFLHRLDHVIAHADYDYLDVHLFDFPDNWPTVVAALRRRLPPDRRDVAIICTEFGGPNPILEPATDDAHHAKRVAEYLNAISRCGLRQAYYFMAAMGTKGECRHWNSGLFRGEVPRPGFEVFKNYLRARRAGE